MQLKTLLPVLAAATPIAALGKATVVNNCAAEVSVWSVGSDVLAAGPLAAGGGTYAETFARDPATGGRALKVTSARDGLYTGAPQLVFAYTLDAGGGAVWYDLSTVFGDGFKGSKVVVASRQTTCPAIVWEGGVSPGGSQVKVCTAEQDVVLTLCA
ncbi:Bys1 family protein [Colletotrichum graminicola]|uniref:Bys1 family protein n=1 Tax=Colletotrichum graminicola (strain M1.001 / M2 / FGSC 10212) TaxID=645133 RepID=E3QKG8_COLGM|nr:Bys1 family protein [Colletotrichum graminicola M1.001]EFQ31356.1 Bys1 family protein [Colletotrichum graminicola M1.001]WDK19382.1 Bys1 family protein [Colletotrichum graminicola]